MKRIIIHILAAALLLNLNLATAFADDKKQTQTPKVKTYDKILDHRYIFDDKIETSAQVAAGSKITIEFEPPVSAMYMVWDTAPNSYTIKYTANGKTFVDAKGENKFLHEYIKLSGETKEIAIEFSGDKQKLCDVYAFGSATPDFVEQWQPPLTKADLLLMPARAGDELLYFGGAIPYYSAIEGKSVQVAYMSSPLDSPKKTHELLRGLYQAGLRAYPVFSRFNEVTATSVEAVTEKIDEDEFIASAVETLRRFRPSVVVGQGNFGDGIQLFSAESLATAVTLSSDGLEYKDSASKYGIWNVPKFYQHAAKQNQITIDYSKKVPATNQTALEMAMAAFKNYSWLTARSIEVSGTYDSRKFGLTTSIVPLDESCTDFFENIELVSEFTESALSGGAAEVGSDAIDADAPVDFELEQSPKPEAIDPVGGNSLAADQVVDEALDDSFDYAAAAAQSEQEAQARSSDISQYIEFFPKVISSAVNTLLLPIWKNLSGYSSALITTAVSLLLIILSIVFANRQD